MLVRCEYCRWRGNKRELRLHESECTYRKRELKGRFNQRNTQTLEYREEILKQYPKFQYHRKKISKLTDVGFREMVRNIEILSKQSDEYEAKLDAEKLAALEADAQTAIEAEERAIKEEKRQAIDEAKRLAQAIRAEKKREKEIQDKELRQKEVEEKLTIKPVEIKQDDPAKQMNFGFSKSGRPKGS